MKFARNNVAFAELLCGNVFQALRLYEEIVADSSVHADLRFISLKGYAQSLLKAKQYEKAIKLIHDALAALEEYDFPNTRAIFFLLHAYATRTSHGAEHILSMEAIDRHLHLLACRHLIEFYKKQGQEKKQLEYYQLAESLGHAGEFEKEVYRI